MLYIIQRYAKDESVRPGEIPEYWNIRKKYEKKNAGKLTKQ